MAGLVPAIHVLARGKFQSWMPGSSPGMTIQPMQPSTRRIPSQSRRHRRYDSPTDEGRNMRRWILTLTLFCSALTGLPSPPPGFGKWLGFPFAGRAEAAGDRTAQMSKRRDQVPPNDDDNEDENPPAADDDKSEDENDEAEDNEEDDDKENDDDKEKDDDDKEKDKE
jgi:hypothetical protein